MWLIFKWFYSVRFQGHYNTRPVGKANSIISGLPRGDQGHQPDQEVQVQELCHRAARALRPQEHPDGGLPHRWLFPLNQVVSHCIKALHAHYIDAWISVAGRIYFGCVHLTKNAHWTISSVKYLPQLKRELLQCFPPRIFLCGLEVKKLYKTFSVKCGLLRPYFRYFADFKSLFKMSNTSA